jgi:hypothetical protein
VSHSSKAASSRPTITAGMNCLRLMRSPKSCGSRETIRDVSCVEHRTKAQTLECQDGHAQGRYRGGAICLRSWAIFCCFLSWPHGSVEWWSRLRACSADCRGSDGGNRERDSSACRAQKPRPGRSARRGFAIGHSTAFQNARHLPRADIQPNARVCEYTP